MRLVRLRSLFVCWQSRCSISAVRMTMAWWGIHVCRASFGAERNRFVDDLNSFFLAFYETENSMQDRGIDVEWEMQYQIPWPIDAGPGEWAHDRPDDTRGHCSTTDTPSIFRYLDMTMDSCRPESPLYYLLVHDHEDNQLDRMVCKFPRVIYSPRRP